MNLLKSILSLLFAFSSFYGYAQMDTIEVSNTKTTYILFNADVDMVDVGTKDFGFSAKDYMVMLKAVKEYGPPTSLMIRTKTEVRVWIIKYNKNPKEILLDTRIKAPVREPVRDQVVVASGKTEIASQPAVVKEGSQDKALKPVEHPKGGYVSSDVYQKRALEKYGATPAYSPLAEREISGNRDVNIRDDIMQGKVNYIFQQKKTYKGVGEIVGGIYFSLHDIFVDREFIYIKIGIHNTSSIAFDLDFVSFERAQGKTFKKREALSNSLLVTTNHETVFTVAPSTEEVVIYVIDLFAFIDNDVMLVKASELGGVRTLKFEVLAKNITTAKVL